MILFTTDPASNLSDLFDSAIERPSNLVIEQLDSDALYAKFLERNLDAFLDLGDRGTYLDREELQRFFELSVPGIDELMAWAHVGDLAEENEGAIIVVDTAPTGHTLRMISAGEHFEQLTAALEAMQEKHREIVQQLARRAVRDAMDAFLEDFDARWRKRRELLTNRPQTAFVPVFLSEAWVVEQTRHLIDEVRGAGIDVPLVILNRSIVRSDCDRDRRVAERDAAAREALAPLPVVDAPRSCVPLDSIGSLRRYFSGASTTSRAQRARMPLDRPARSPALHLPRLLFLAGKGGVGKTTCAASISLQLARRHPERGYTVISVDPAHSLRDVFANQAPPSNLNVETIDTREKWRRFRDAVGEEIKRAVDAITPRGISIAYDKEAIEKLVEIAPPGADELFAIDRLAELIADETRGAIVVDTAPTGHFLRLLDLPKTAGEWVREFIRILLRYREVIPPGGGGARESLQGPASGRGDAPLR